MVSLQKWTDEEGRGNGGLPAELRVQKRKRLTRDRQPPRYVRVAEAALVCRAREIRCSGILVLQLY